MKTSIYRVAIMCIVISLSIILFLGVRACAYRQIFHNELDASGEIANTIIDNLEDGFKIRLNTEGYEKGYYTEFFSPNEFFDLQGFNTASIKIKNNESENLRINFVCMDEIREYQVDEGGKIYIKDTSGEVREIKKEYGTFDIEGNKECILYIPFKSLNLEGISYVNNFGFSVTCEENKKIDFDITNFTVLSYEEGKDFDDLLKIKIIGNDEIEIPTNGESIESYRVEGLDSKIYFEILDKKRGVYVDGDGILHVKPGATPGDIRLKVKDLNGTNLYKNIKLKNSWSKSEEDRGNEKFAVPSKIEVRENMFSKIISTKSSVILIDAGIIIMFLLFLIIIIHWKGYLNIDWRTILSIVIVYFLFVGLSIMANIYNIKINEIPKINKAMNIGNALEAPKNIPWDITMNEEYIDKIKEAGFDTIRLPIRFSDYADKENDYNLDEDFMKEIDYFINYALNSKLNVIIDMHHFDEIMEAPEDNKEKLKSMWNQISKRYKNYPNNLLYEILNEPKKNLTESLWNEYANEIVEIIRKNEEKKLIIIGGVDYNSYKGLLKLKIPKNKNLMLTFHYYEPNKFTFQGEKYHEGFEKLSDIEWNATKEELEEIDNTFKTVSDFAKENDLKVFLGEFGANKNAPRKSRILWTKSVREIAEKYDFSWGYWEMASTFGIYNLETHTFDESMLKALIEEIQEEKQ